MIEFIIIVDSIIILAINIMIYNSVFYFIRDNIQIYFLHS